MPQPDAPRAVDAALEIAVAALEYIASHESVLAQARTLHFAMHGRAKVALQEIAALRAAREPAGAMAALAAIRHQLDLRLPSEQVGPEWQRTVRVPVERLIVIDAVLQTALGEPQHTDEPMPPSPTVSESSLVNYPKMQALVELIKAAKEWRDVVSGKLTVPPKGYIDAEGRLHSAVDAYEKASGG